MWSTGLLIFFTVLTFCNGQSTPQHPQAYGRTHQTRTQQSQQQQDAGSEVSINTDRLVRTIESRFMNLMRAENNEIKQQLQRIENTQSKVDENLNFLQDDLKSIQDKIQASEGQVQGSTGDNTTLAKLHYLYTVMNQMRGSVGKIEKEVLYVKRSLRAVHNMKSEMQQISTFSRHITSEIINPQACPLSDPNQLYESGIRQLRRDFVVQCEMDADNGGWIVIQARYSGRTDFARSWSEYKQGFGNIAGEYWLGLDKIYELTSARLHELRIEMEDFKEMKKFAHYDLFSIASEEHGYALRVLGQYDGDAGDSLSYHAGMKFSTFDVDNDRWDSGSCARSHFGGWWYNACDESNLNGKYFTEDQEKAEEFLKSQNEAIRWKTFKDMPHSLRNVRMMIRPIDLE